MNKPTFMGLGNAVMVSFKDDDNDGNIGVITHTTNNPNYVKVRFNAFDEPRQINVHCLLDQTYKIWDIQNQN